MRGCLEERQSDHRRSRTADLTVGAHLELLAAERPRTEDAQGGRTHVVSTKDLEQWLAEIDCRPEALSTSKIDRHFATPSANPGWYARAVRPRAARATTLRSAIALDAVKTRERNRK